MFIRAVPWESESLPCRSSPQMAGQDRGTPVPNEMRSSCDKRGNSPVKGETTEMRITDRSASTGSYRGLEAKATFYKKWTSPMVHHQRKGADGVRLKGPNEVR